MLTSRKQKCFPLRGYEAYQNRINRGYEAYQNRINRRNRFDLFLLLYVENNMKWINVNEEYLDYLRKYEYRIPHTNYGDDKYKPFFGILFEKDEFYYVTQVSHAQERHKKMKRQPDFFKIFDSEDRSRLLAVVNLNYMFPIPKKDVSDFKKSKIDTYRTFKNEKQKSKYIDLLDRELRAINELNLSVAAKNLYNKKYEFPESYVSKRCIDFKMLEKYGKEWIGGIQNNENEQNVLATEVTSTNPNIQPTTSESTEETTVETTNTAEEL